MAVEDNKDIVRRFFDELMNKGNTAQVDEFLAPEFVNHFGGMGAADRETFRRLLPLYPAAFPDVHITIEDLVAEDDKVSARFTLRGTNQGAFMGMPPTGRQVTMSGMALFRLAGGKIVEEYVNEDTLGMMQQLTGPPPGQAPPAGA